MIKNLFILQNNESKYKKLQNKINFKFFLISKIKLLLDD